MRTVILSLIIGFMSLTISSCVTTRSTSKINKIELGMTKDEIRQMFGQPVYRNASAEGEQWGYHKQVGMAVGPEQVLLVISFDRNGKVSEFETNKEFPHIPHF